MCCICTTGAGACRTPKSAQNVGKPEGPSTDVNISVLFSSHPYDFIIENSEFKELSSNIDTSTYGKFSTYLVYPNIDADKAPKVSPIIHMPIFIDVASEEYGVAAGLCSYDRMLGFLSRAISAVKDYLYKLHLEGKHGKVHFYLGAYDPLEALMFAMADLLGVPCNRNEYKDFVNSVKKKCWFAVFSGWMKKLNWEPTVETTCVYLGKDDIVVQESQVSKNRKRWPEVYRILKEMHSEKYYYRRWDLTFQEDIDEWKKKYHAAKIGGSRKVTYDGYTIFKKKNFIDSGHWYIPNSWEWAYRVGNRPGKDGKPHYSKERQDGETEYIAHPFEGQLYSYETLTMLKNEMEAADPAPKMWGVKNAPRPSGKSPQQQMAEYIAELEREKAEWERNTFNPEMAAYNDAIAQIDERDKADSNGYKIWKRKKDEDEAISNEWDVDKDKIEFHGKIVSRAELKARAAKLKAIQEQKQKAIDHAKDQRFWTIVLEFVAVFQMLLAVASFGVGSIGVAIALSAVDAGIEIFKANIEVAYFDKKFTDGEMWLHWISIALDGVSVILSAPRIFCAKPPKLKIPKSEIKAPPKVESPIIKPEAKPSISYQSYVTTPQNNMSVAPKPKLEPVPVPEYKPMGTAQIKGSNKTVVGVSHNKAEALDLGKKANRGNTKNGTNTMEVNWENETGGQNMWVATKGKNGKINVEHMSAKEFKQRTGIDPSELNKNTKAKKAQQSAIKQNKEIEAQNAASQNAAPQNDALAQLHENSVATAERSGNSTLSDLTNEPPAPSKVNVTDAEKSAAKKERSSLLQRAQEYGSMVMDNLKKEKSDFKTGLFTKVADNVADSATFVWTLYGIGSNAQGLMGNSIGWSIVNISETHDIRNSDESAFFASIQNLERKELPEQNVIAYLPK